MNKAIINVTWEDLIGTWRNVLGEDRVYDFTISSNGQYELYHYESKKRWRGEISSEYLSTSNTVRLMLENYSNIELFQLAQGDIILKINNETLLFKKILSVEP